MTDCLSRDHRSSKSLAVDLGDGIRVGPERAGCQDIALLDLQEDGTGVDGRDGGLDLLKLVVGEATAEEDGDGHLAVVRGEGGVDAKAGGWSDVEVAAEDGGQLGESNVGIEAGVDDFNIWEKLLADRLGDLCVTAVHGNGDGGGGGHGV